MKKFIKNVFIIIFLLLIYILFSAQSYTFAISSDLSNAVFRLHVLANSDSKEDQDLKLKVRDYQIVVITDGKNGAYAYDGKKYYICPVFDGPVVSTLGAGDAFASTFCAALQRTNRNLGKSLMYASVNSAGVVSKFGATQGLLTFEQIERKLSEHPNYHYDVIEG